MGRVRRPGDHRPLGSHGRAVDEEAAGHPLYRAERSPHQEHDAHVLALGLAVDPVLPEGNFAPLEEVVAWIAENGGVPYLAHTYWSGLRTEQWWDCPGLYGIEVWNSGCELELGRGDSSIHGTRRSSPDGPFCARDRRFAPPRL